MNIYHIQVKCYKSQCLSTDLKCPEISHTFPGQHHSHYFYPHTDSMKQKKKCLKFLQWKLEIYKCIYIHRHICTFACMLTYIQMCICWAKIFHFFLLTWNKLFLSSVEGDWHVPKPMLILKMLILKICQSWELRTPQEPELDDLDYLLEMCLPSHMCFVNWVPCKCMRRKITVWWFTLKSSNTFVNLGEKRLPFWVYLKRDKHTCKKTVAVILA